MSSFKNQIKILVRHPVADFNCAGCLLCAFQKPIKYQSVKVIKTIKSYLTCIFLIYVRTCISANYFTCTLLLTNTPQASWKQVPLQKKLTSQRMTCSSLYHSYPFFLIPDMSSFFEEMCRGYLSELHTSEWSEPGLYKWRSLTLDL